MKLFIAITGLVVIQALLGCASLEPEGIQEAVPSYDALENPPPYRTHGGVI